MMNANELAKLLEVDSWRQQAEQIENLKQWERRHLDVIEKQQAEIETLKKDNKELHAIAQRMAMAESDARKSLQWFKDAKERQSEPVAWMSVELNGRTVLATYEFETAIPLYTHPVKEHFEDEPQAEELHEIMQSNAELTDEEIDELANKYLYVLNDVPYANDIKDFARAILRKAQEK